MTPASSGVPRLHVVTDDAIVRRPDFMDVASAVLAAGTTSVALHLRGPGVGGGRILHLAEALRAPAETHGAILAVNDRVDVALAAGLEAVHLGSRSLPIADAARLLGPRVRIGASVHDATGAALAMAQGSAWLFVGTIFPTPTHPGRAGSGCGLVEEIAALGDTPLLGIGGVSVARVPEVRLAGAHGVAVIRGVWDAGDPAVAVHDYLVALA